MSYLPPHNQFFKKGLHDTRGLIITGTHPRCGKTVAATGLSGVLNHLGFQIQAIKPLSFLPSISLRKGYEQAYFDRLNAPLQAVEVFTAESPQTLTNMDWQRLMDACRRRVYPYLLETPGNLASPLRFSDGDMVDATTLAQMLEVPILLVTTKQEDLISRLAMAFAYCHARHTPIVGWLAVETTPTPPIPNWEQDILYLTHHYPIPYLGELSYSPSISVEALQQGNLFRTTEMGLDLLPIQQALDVGIPL
jgi:dethiobiotin synthetase